ncbi:MAG: SUMF1/EgtB/PvdO family nonheme iron enzyme [Planctomycetota bacterium]|nr:SUMF1/EgtB/PvdO family nonheme iron enzyme [Planctomycetota bacterium]
MPEINHANNQMWEVQGAGLLDTREIFARLAANQLNNHTPCRASEDPDWAPINMRFSLISSGDHKRKYGLLKKLGDGAFGTVHLAFDASSKEPGRTGRLVAIKKPTQALLGRYAKLAGKKNNPELSDDLNAEQARSWAKLQIGQFFSHEATLTARMALSDHVVKVIDHDITVPYMVLEYCNGGSLADRMTQPFDLRQVLQWGWEISSALAAAHSLKPDRLVHRDLKPDNILVHDEVLKISDFGTSQLAKETESLRSLEGGYTPLYGAPEAFDGRAYPATDVWSLGVILYELICGQRPFQGDSSLAALAQAIMVKPHPPLNQRPGLTVPAELYNLVDACLAKEAEDRPSAADLAQFFAAQLSGQSTKLEVKKDASQFAEKLKETNSQRNSELNENEADPTERRGRLSLGLGIASLLVTAFLAAYLFDWLPGFTSLAPEENAARNVDVPFQLKSHSSGQFVKTAEIVLIGKTTPHSRVNAKAFQASAKTDKDGVFQLFLKLKEGLNAIDIDVKTGEQNHSESLSLTLDNRPPQIEIDGEHDGRLRLNPNSILSGQINEAQLKSLTINGTTVPVQDSQFKWPLAISKAVTVSLIARDEAGWQSSKTITVSPSFKISEMAVLNDRLQWNKTDEEQQDWVIKQVGKKLGANYQWTETKTYDCNGISHRIASFRHVKSGLILNLIPGGAYTMGSIKPYDETPMHQVTIKPFLLGQFELRQACWDKIGGKDTRKVRGSDFPIEAVSFADCQEWLNEAGSGLRLPSEAEWEYACRAGSTTKYYWGEEIDSAYLWFRENRNQLKEKSAEVTLHFQTKKWNAFGLVDMSGNRWEWCQDQWVGDYRNGPSSSLPRSGDPSLRVARGGSWLTTAPDCRSANRGNFVVAARDSSLSLRVAKSLD